MCNNQLPFFSRESFLASPVTLVPFFSFKRSFISQPIFFFLLRLLSYYPGFFPPLNHQPPFLVVFFWFDFSENGRHVFFPQLFFGAPGSSPSLQQTSLFSDPFRLDKPPPPFISFPPSGKHLVVQFFPPRPFFSVLSAHRIVPPSPGRLLQT